MSPPTEFDVLGPLPDGTTVLEASAGTGKTFTIAALVARYVAEGVATMDQLLVVSFSRESTRELRDRVRARLVHTRDGLADPGSVQADHVLTHLAGCDAAELVRRRQRVADALNAFDAATVTTTHGFCQQVLASLGTAADHDTSAVLVEDLRDLVTEVADDLFLRKWGTPGADPPALTRAQFLDLAQTVVRDRATSLVPGPDADGLPGLRARIARSVLDEVERRKRRQGLVDYDDLLLRLDETLRDEVTGPVALQRLRDRYRIVLVDEFQDTDPVQWRILREPFHGHRTLVLIGDPKQAIYGFRGADVHAYLDAREVAGEVHTLPTSFRSDPALLAGLDRVFRGAALGDPRIRVPTVGAAHAGRLVEVPGHTAPVRLRVVRRAGHPSVKGMVGASTARATIARDLAAEVVAMLGGSGSSGSGGGRPGAVLTPRHGGEPRPLVPADVAVLVRTNAHAQEVSAALRAAHVPCVVTGRTSVFDTEAAQEWQLLLEALEQPHVVTRVARLALGAFVGLSPAEVADGAQSHDRAARDAPGRTSAVSDLGLRLRGWARVLDERGVAALSERVSADGRLQERLLARRGGERLLTDLRHVAQALHQAALDDQLRLTALVAWLRRRREQARLESTVERSRRLDSDAAAVQVITVHTSKGLEFPVVLVPFAWSHWPGNEPTTAAYHDEHGRRWRDVGGSRNPDWQPHARAQQAEEADDELRLAYVGLTRAMSHLVLWWAPTANTGTAPLHRLLFADDPSAGPAQRLPVPGDDAALTTLRSRASADLSVEVVEPREPGRFTPPAGGAVTLAAAELHRSVDTGWRRTSYSALTAAAYDQQPRLGSEPDVVQKDDEPELAADDGLGRGDPDEALREVVSPWDQLPGGTGFGTLVHGALEDAPDLGDDDAVREALGVRLARSAASLDGELLAGALLTSLATPLGPLAGGLALRDLTAGDRLRELDFELPLAGGDEPSAVARVLTDLVPLWRKHCGDDALAGYADALAEIEPTPLRGYLTGSIDAVLRVHGDDGTPRFVVADYKTNRLGGYEEPLTAWHYRPQALTDAMVHAHYPLQSLLYCVALHRFLRWRQPHYDPEVHLGGSLYLFLRGMVGPGAGCADGSVPGVHAWQPPAALVTGASDVLAGGS